MAQRWKDLFRPWILARGREYFECGKVVDFEENDSVIRGQVSGIRAYQVIFRDPERMW